MSLKYEPSLEPLHMSAKHFLRVRTSPLATALSSRVALSRLSVQGSGIEGLYTKSHTVGTSLIPGSVTYVSIISFLSIIPFMSICLLYLVSGYVFNDGERVC
jgi:hypothetical protein